MSERRLYRLDPRDTTGVAFGLSALQVGVGGGGIMVAVVGYAQGFLPAAGAILVALVGLATAAARKGGEAALGVGWQWLRFQLRGGDRRRVAPVSLLAPGGPAALALPPGLDGLTVIPTGLDGGVVWDRASNRYSATVRAAGGQFALLDGSEQERLLARFGEALAPFCREPAGLVDVRWSEWAAPAGANEQLAYLAERGLPGGVDGCESRVPEAWAAYSEALSEAGPAAVGHEVLFTVTVDGDRVKAGARHRGDRRAAALEALAAQVGHLSTRLARGGVRVSMPLSAGEICRAIRVRLDPAALAALDVRARHRNGDRAEVTAAQAGPMVCEVHADRVGYDGSVHRAFWVCEWPLQAVCADFLAGLILDGSSTRSVAVLYEPRTARQSRSSTRRRVTKMRQEGKVRRDKGFYEPAELDAQEGAARAREAEILSGHPELAYVGIVDVAASGVEELEAACEKVSAAANDCGVELRQLVYRHELAVACCLPVPKGLLPEWSRR